MIRPSMSMFASAADYHDAMTEWLSTEHGREVGERMAFEAHMKDKLGQRPTPNGGGSYAVTEVRWAWDAWQARAKLDRPSGVRASDKGVTEERDG
jgi:hypothetical protein